MNILIVNAYLIGDSNATGITMQNFLHKIEDVQYLQFCMDINKKNHCELVPTIFLSEKQIPLQFFSSQLFSSRKNNTKSQKTIHSMGLSIDWKRDFLRALMDISPYFITKKQWHKINNFKPDMIYTMIGGSIRMLKITNKISKKLNIPIIFHCMDDWRVSKYTTSIFTKPFNIYLNQLLKNIHKRCILNLAISEKMAQVYEKDYQVPYTYASNCIKNFNDERYNPNKNDAMRIIFSGGLHFGRMDTLLFVGNLIDQLNKDGYNINLEIFVPTDQLDLYSNYFIFKHTKIFQYVAKENQLKNLKRADILLHVESTNEKEINYMMLSFSTKLVEYMAAERAIIGYGKKEMASIDYIASNQCGWVAETQNELKDIFIEAYEQIDKRVEYSKNSFSIVHEKHTQKIVQKRIFNVFKFVDEKGKIQFGN